MDITLDCLHQAHDKCAGAAYDEFAELWIDCGCICHPGRVE